MPEGNNKKHPIQNIRGVGPKIAESLSNLGIYQVEDAVFHLPYRYEDRTNLTPIGDAPFETPLLIEGEIVKSTVVFRGRRMLITEIYDGTGRLTMRMFHFAFAQHKNLKEGYKIRCFGSIRHGPKGKEMIHPQYQVFSKGDEIEIEDHLTPIYPSTSNLQQGRIRKMIQESILYCQKNDLLKEYWEKDNEAGEKIVRESKLTWFDPKIVLEGGAIDVNGRGICLTTSSCLLNTNRNGGLSSEKMEKYLKSYLGIKKIIWLDGVLKGDDTDGHVDNLARFVNPSTIVYISEEDESDENYLGLKGIEETLKKARDLDGKPFVVIPLPMPRAIKDNNFRLPASYANFYIGNNAVLVPAFNDSNDVIAQRTLKTCFPQKKIVPIDSRILIKGQGGIHCITQQQPMHSD